MSEDEYKNMEYLCYNNYYDTDKSTTLPESYDTAILNEYGDWTYDSIVPTHPSKQTLRESKDASESKEKGDATLLFESDLFKHMDFLSVDLDYGDSYADLDKPGNEFKRTVVYSDISATYDTTYNTKYDIRYTLLKASLDVEYYRSLFPFVSPYREMDMIKTPHFLTVYDSDYIEDINFNYSCFNYYDNYIARTDSCRSYSYYYNSINMDGIKYRSNQAYNYMRNYQFVPYKESFKLQDQFSSYYIIDKFQTVKQLKFMLEFHHPIDETYVIWDYSNGKNSIAFNDYINNQVKELIVNKVIPLHVKELNLKVVLGKSNVYDDSYIFDNRYKLERNTFTIILGYLLDYRMDVARVQRRVFDQLKKYVKANKKKDSDSITKIEYLNFYHTHSMKPMTYLNYHKKEKYAIKNEREIYHWISNLYRLDNQNKFRESMERYDEKYKILNKNKNADLDYDFKYSHIIDYGPKLYQPRLHNTLYYDYEYLNYDMYTPKKTMIPRIRSSIGNDAIKTFMNIAYKYYMEKELYDVHDQTIYTQKCSIKFSCFETPVKSLISGPLYSNQYIKYIISKGLYIFLYFAISIVFLLMMNFVPTLVTYWNYKAIKYPKVEDNIKFNYDLLWGSLSSGSYIPFVSISIMYYFYIFYFRFKEVDYSQSNINLVTNSRLEIPWFKIEILTRGKNYTLNRIKSMISDFPRLQYIPENLTRESYYGLFSTHMVANYLVVFAIFVLMLFNFNYFLKNIFFQLRWYRNPLWASSSGELVANYGTDRTQLKEEQVDSVNAGPDDLALVNRSKMRESFQNKVVNTVRYKMGGFNYESFPSEQSIPNSLLYVFNNFWYAVPYVFSYVKNTSIDSTYDRTLKKNIFIEYLLSYGLSNVYKNSDIMKSVLLEGDIKDEYEWQKLVDIIGAKYFEEDNYDILFEYLTVKNSILTKIYDKQLSSNMSSVYNLLTKLYQAKMIWYYSKIFKNNFYLLLSFILIMVWVDVLYVYNKTLKDHKIDLSDITNLESINKAIELDNDPDNEPRDSVNLNLKYKYSLIDAMKTTKK